MASSWGLSWLTSWGNSWGVAVRRSTSSGWSREYESDRIKREQLEEAARALAEAARLKERRIAAQARRLRIASEQLRKAEREEEPRLIVRVEELTGILDRMLEEQEEEEIIILLLAS